MAFFDELKKNLSGVTDTVAKTSENDSGKTSSDIISKLSLTKTFVLVSTTALPFLYFISLIK